MSSLNKQIVENLLISAFEGGSGYWCIIKAHNKKSIPECEFLSTLLMHEGSEMLIMHDDLDKPKRVTRDDVVRAWDEFSTNAEYSRHYANAINGDDDAETGDVFLQIVVICEVIYG